MVRAFIAIELSESIQSSIKQFQDRLKSSFDEATVRWVPTGNIHLTLKFLGDIEAAQIDPIVQALERVVTTHASFVFRVEGFGCFPSCKRPRVLWLGIENSDGVLFKVQQEIEAGLQELGFAPEGRRFHPHLTLGRIKKTARRDQLQALSRQLEVVERPVMGTMQAHEVYLIESRLSPAGAQYSHLGHATLGQTS